MQTDVILSEAKDLSYVRSFGPEERDLRMTVAELLGQPLRSL
jgi:hypothetical protein